MQFVPPSSHLTFSQTAGARCWNCGFGQVKAGDTGSLWQLYWILWDLCVSWWEAVPVYGWWDHHLWGAQPHLSLTTASYAAHPRCLCETTPVASAFMSGSKIGAGGLTAKTLRSMQGECAQGAVGSTLPGFRTTQRNVKNVFIVFIFPDLSRWTATWKQFIVLNGRLLFPPKCMAGWQILKCPNCAHPFL